MTGLVDLQPVRKVDRLKRVWEESFLWSSLLDPGMALADAYEQGDVQVRPVPGTDRRCLSP